MSSALTDGFVFTFASVCLDHLSKSLPHVSTTRLYPTINSDGHNPNSPRNRGPLTALLALHNPCISQDKFSLQNQLLRRQRATSFNSNFNFASVGRHCPLLGCSKWWSARHPRSGGPSCDAPWGPCVTVADGSTLTRQRLEHENTGQTQHSRSSAHMKMGVLSNGEYKLMHLREQGRGHSTLLG